MTPQRLHDWGAEKEGTVATYVHVLHQQLRNCWHHQQQNIFWNPAHTIPNKTCFERLKCVSLYNFSRKNLPWQPVIFLTSRKGASNGKFRSGSQVGRHWQPSDITLKVFVNEWSFCVEWQVWEICVISAGSCYSSSLGATVAELILELLNESFHHILWLLWQRILQRILANMHILYGRSHHFLTQKWLIHSIIWSEFPNHVKLSNIGKIQGR